MLARLRKFLLGVAYPLTGFIGKVHMPYSHKQITSKQYREIKKILLPGMAMCTQTRGEMTNIFIPGFWSHAAIYVGDSKVMEAVSKGVVVTDLIDFLLTKDAVIVKDPIFADRDQMIDAVTWALSQEGKGYDFYFDKSNDFFYCAEFLWLAYERTIGEMPFTKIDTMWGLPTVVPEDIVDAHKKWATRYDSRYDSK